MIENAAENRFCIIGAGPSGLTAAKNLKQAGIPFDCFERQDDIGGLWNYGKPSSSIYRSTHLISSKPLTQYIDFPMPKTYPDYPSHEQALAYFRSYAEHFGLHEHIQLNTAVERVERMPRGWRVTLNDQSSPRIYRAVIVANGHHWDPLFPDFPGEFSGQTLHSGDYKTPDALHNRRVLVIGAGNSGCDIAVESAQNAAATFHSMRRGYHFIPKFLFGRPVDQGEQRLHSWRWPLWMRRWFIRFLTRVSLGPSEFVGLPKPDHKLFETHPIINSQMFYFVGHGSICPKPDIKRFDGKRVEFVDGSEEKIDLIIYATGFRVSFPFFDDSCLPLVDGCPDLHLNVFHRQWDDLFFVGLIQPNSGLWGLADYQSQLVTRYVLGLERSDPAARRLQQRKQASHLDLSGGIHYVESARHGLEVEYYSYRKLLQKNIRRFGSR